MMHKPILCLDFDGVIHSYSSGWQGPRNIPDQPVDGALEFIVRIISADEFQLAIFSSRSRYFLARKAMKQWLFNQLMTLAGLDPDDRWYIPDVQKGEIPKWLWRWITMYSFADPWHDEAKWAIKRLIKKIKFPTRKPPAFLIIDDRALTFHGYFPSFKAIREFEPWNRQKYKEKPHD